MKELTALVQQVSKEPQESQLLRAYETVRDITYGDIGSRDPFDVLAAKKGTCSGKHALLKLLLEKLGYDVQSWFAKHDFGKFPIASWPEALADFKDSDIPDYHDFLKVQIGDEWVTIDAVFDPSLASLGFPLLQWDGQTNMQLPIESSETFQAGGDMETHKKQLIGALTDEQQAKRKTFLSSLTAWLDENR